MVRKAEHILFFFASVSAFESISFLKIIPEVKFSFSDGFIADMAVAVSGIKGVTNIAAGIERMLRKDLLHPLGSGHVKSISR